MKYELSRDIINGYRAWDTLERQLADQSKAAGTVDASYQMTEVVDIDVAPHYDNPLVFDTREDVQATFVGFMERADSPGISGQEYIRRRLGASLLHLRLKEGDEVDFIEHAQTAMNVEPEIVAEDDIDDHRQKIDDILKRHGLRFQKNYKEKYEDILVLQETSDQLQERLLETAEWVGRLLVAQAGLDRSPVTSMVRPTVVEVDQPWAGYFSTEKGEPVWLMNAHRRHRYTRARIVAINFHEGAHAQDFMERRDAIDKEGGNPLFRLTTFHTPEIMPAEVYALAHEQIGLRNRAQRGADGWQYLFQAEYHDYLEKVWNNAHIWINTGETEASVIRYVKERLPYEDHENIEKRIPESRDITEARAYLSAYEPAMKLVRRILAHPSSRAHVLNEVKRYPYNEHQMRGFVPGGRERASLVAS